MWALHAHAFAETPTNPGFNEAFGTNLAAPTDGARPRAMDAAFWVSDAVNPWIRAISPSLMIADRTVD